MNSRYQINRVFVALSTLFIIGLIFAIITDSRTVKDKLPYFILCLIFVHSIFIMLFSYITLTDNAIRHKIFFFPFFAKIRECRFEEIRKITYDFVIFEEIGSFKIHSWDDDVNKIAVINFLTNNKKEIIQKILEKRPDLKLDDWVWERVLNYKIVRKKFLIVSSIIILMGIAVYIMQQSQR